MIEISNEELAKVLNLWTGTEDWRVCYGTLECSEWIQRKSDGTICSPIENSEDKEAHALVNFMLKERKYPNDIEVFYPYTYTNNPEVYIEWVKNWEKQFGDIPQEELCIPPSEQIVDHSIPVRYDHLISTEELVKRAQERWPEDGWDNPKVGVIDSEHRQFACPTCTIGTLFNSDSICMLEEWCVLRAKLLTIISEAEQTIEKPVCQDIPTDSRTKAERFYSFLATPQPDISPGLWGIEREAEPLTIYSKEVCRQCLGMGKFDGVLCVKDGCKARL